ncbi:GntR family transcriptional regulator [Mycolicibacterium sp. CBM1]
MLDRRHSALLFRLAVRPADRSARDVLGELRRVILDGALPPGTSIPVGEVADAFGVSHIPVREALKTLTGEGLIQHRRNLGYAVAQLTASELAEMYIVRQTLETAALAAAVEQATDAERRTVAETNDLLESALREGDPQSYHRQSRHFHLGLARPSRMLRLLHMLEYAWNITEPVQLMVHVDHSQRTVLHDDHRVMLQAFLDRDTAQLLAASTIHHQRLNAVVSTLPADSGLIADDPPTQ